MYRYVPARLKVTLYVTPTPPRCPLLVKLGVPTDCTVCGTAGPVTQVQVTLVPTATVSTAASVVQFLSLRK